MSSRSWPKQTDHRLAALLIAVADAAMRGEDLEYIRRQADGIAAGLVFGARGQSAGVAYLRRRQAVRRLYRELVVCLGPEG